jgi:hypothetical protein
MLLYISKLDLQAWIDKAQLASLIYHRVRRELWSELVQDLDEAPAEADQEKFVKIPHDLFASIKSALVSRNDGLSDAKMLAFEKALEELQDMLD